MYNQRLSLKSIVKSDNLDHFNDEFESLLQSHEQHRKSKQFVKERLSIISSSSNNKINNKFYNINKLKRKKKLNRDNNSKNNKQRNKEFDELEDIKSKLQILQNVLKYLPEDIDYNDNNNNMNKRNDDNDNKHNNDNNDEMEIEAICSGFLVIVGGNISEATRFYTELINNVLYLRREPNSKIKQVITISFIQSTALDQKHNDKEGDNETTNNNQKNKTMNNNKKYQDLFLAHLESRSANHSFKLFSPTGIYVISASCLRDKTRFSKCIESELLKLFDNETWIAKIEASQQLLPIEKSQFEIQIERHEQIMNSLTLTGLAHNVGLLGSTNKEKSGVMRILKYTHSHSYTQNNHSNNNNNKKHNKWEDHFFVLAHCTLYYFQHDPDSQITHSSMPKSFIPLKYATIDLDIERIKSDRFVFYISTPLRTVYLRCRHPVALSEWVSSLYKAQQQNDINTHSQHILNKIRIIRSKVSTLNKLLKEKKGIKLFDNYLKSIKSQSILRCWLAILHWKQLQKKKHKQQQDDEKKNDDDNDDDDDDDNDENNIQKQAEIIFEQYINDDEAEENKNCIWNCLDSEDYDKELIMDCKKYVYLKSSDNTYISKLIETFDEILEILDDKLNYEFSKNFIKTKQYLSLQKKYDSKDKYLPLPLNREINNFEDNSIIILIITNSDLSTKEIKLSSKKTIATIGRDCSNIIVLDDAHVSRSHARIQYNNYNAYFTDLGSHHGSYLNGQRVLHERLKHSDRLKIGGCDIQFIVKIKKNLMKNVFNKMFSNNNNNNNNNNDNNKAKKDKRRDTVSSVAFM